MLWNPHNMKFKNVINLISSFLQKLLSNDLLLFIFFTKIYTLDI